MIYIDYYEFKDQIIEICCSETHVKYIKYTEKIQNKNPNNLTDEVIRQLNMYFNCELKTFNLPLDMSNYTDFQFHVLSELQKIDYLITYSHLADKCGNKNASRAVGSVMSRNKFPIIIPCHLVVSKKDIGNYTGASLKIKDYLIKKTTGFSYHN